jgi:CRISPR-associated protein Cas5d
MKGKKHVLEVWGELACFTRPEAKVERLSYPIATPSAARGIFDAIYWKPDDDFYWQIEQIEMLRLPRYLALRRNEVKNKADGESTILAWASGKSAPETPLRRPYRRRSQGPNPTQTMALEKRPLSNHCQHVFRRGRSMQAQDAQFERRLPRASASISPTLGVVSFPPIFARAVGGLAGRSGHGPGLDALRCL